MAGVESCTFSTPKRYTMELNLSETLMETPRIEETVKSNGDCKHTPQSCKRESRRGRPGADMIQSLINEGANSPSRIKCTVCARVFPRFKSLSAHMRTHTSDRPYKCDFPGCDKSFNQSGQMKTHQRLHTGEKPFRCTYEGGCSARYAHPNRHCTEHPYAPIKRCDDAPLTLQIPESERTEEVVAWFEKFKEKRKQRTPARSKSKRELYVTTPDTPKEATIMEPEISISMYPSKSKRVLGEAFVDADFQTPEKKSQMDFSSPFFKQNSRNMNDPSFYDSENYHGTICFQKPIPASPKEHRVLQNTENTLPIKPLQIDLDGIKPLSDTSCSLFRTNIKTEDNFYYNPLEKHESDGFPELMEEVISLPAIQTKRTISETTDLVNNVTDDSYKMRLPKKRWIQIHCESEKLLINDEEPLNLCVNKSKHC